MTLINLCSLVTFAIGLKRVVWNNNSDGERFMWIGLGVQLALYPLQILQAHLAAKHARTAFEANWPAKVASVAGLFGITPTNPVTLQIIRDFLPLMPLLQAIAGMCTPRTPTTAAPEPPRECECPGESNTNWTSPLFSPLNVGHNNPNPQPGDTLSFEGDPQLTSRLRIYNHNAKIMEEVAAAREARSCTPQVVPDSISFARRQAAVAASTAAEDARTAETLDAVFDDDGGDPNLDDRRPEDFPEVHVGHFGQGVAELEEQPIVDDAARLQVEAQ